MRFGTTSPSPGSPQQWTFAGGDYDFGPDISPGTPTLLVAEIHRDLGDLYTFKYWVNPSWATLNER